MALRTGIDSGLNKRISNSYDDFARRARARGVALNHTRLDFRAKVLHRIRDGSCLYCGKPLTEENFSADHFRPIDRGGSFDLDNVVVCCLSCNLAKGTMDGQEFGDLMGLMAQWADDVRKNVLARLKAGGKAVRGR